MSHRPERAGEANPAHRVRLPPPPRAPDVRLGVTPAAGKLPSPLAPPRLPIAQAPSAAVAQKPKPHSPTARQPSASSPADTFPAEEPSSFNTRLTPVVPASWPDIDPDDTTTIVRSSVPARAAAAPAPPPSESGIARHLPDKGSLRPALARPSEAPEISEQVFWDSQPKYSVPPASLIPAEPRPRPSLLRSIVAKLLFFVIVSAVVTLACYEISVVFRIPWLSPLPILKRLHLG